MSDITRWNDKRHAGPVAQWGKLYEATGTTPSVLVRNAATATANAEDFKAEARAAYIAAEAAVKAGPGQYRTAIALAANEHTQKSASIEGFEMPDDPMPALEDHDRAMQALYAASEASFKGARGALDAVLAEPAQRVILQKLWSEAVEFQPKDSDTWKAIEDRRHANGLVTALAQQIAQDWARQDGGTPDEIKRVKMQNKELPSALVTVADIRKQMRTEASNSPHAQMRSNAAAAKARTKAADRKTANEGALSRTGRLYSDQETEAEEAEAIAVS